ncbi:15541_t:CDS:1, partial [Cetraspora pellucida]
MQQNGSYLLISTYEGKLVNVFNLEMSQSHENLTVPLTQDPIIEHEDDYIIEGSDDEQDTYESQLSYLYKILDK